MVAEGLYPFRSRYADVRGRRMHYVDEGAGEPVVMLHGNPTWSFYYRNLIRELAPRMRVIAPDHIGCGLSEKPPAERYGYCLADRLEDLDVFLEALGVRSKVSLVVHDWGGMIGFAWAARNPEKIRRLVAMNTAAFPLPAGKRLPASLRLARGPLGPLLVRGLNLFAAGAARLCARRGLAPEVRAGYLEPYRSWADRVAVLRFVQDIPLGPRDPSYAVVAETARRLDRLCDKPLLILWGERDFVFDRDFLAEWRGRFPRARVHVFPDAGHYVLEDAGDRAAALVESFLG